MLDKIIAKIEGLDEAAMAAARAEKAAKAAEEN